MGPLLFIIGIIGIVYVIMGKKAPETRKQIIGWLGVALAFVGAWLGDLFQSLPIGG